MVFYKFNKKCILKIFIFIFILYLFYFFYTNLFSKKYSLEGLETNKFKNMGIDTSIYSNNAYNFCLYNQKSGSQLNNRCQSLTNLNCNKTECCIWQGKKETGKCVAGSNNEPMFPNQ